MQSIATSVHARVSHGLYIRSIGSQPVILLVLCQPEKTLDLDIVHKHVLHAVPPFHLLAGSIVRYYDDVRIAAIWTTVQYSCCSLDLLENTLTSGSSPAP
jgi:hypothetical protein